MSSHPRRTLLTRFRRKHTRVPRRKPVTRKRSAKQLESPKRTRPVVKRKTTKLLDDDEEPSRQTTARSDSAFIDAFEPVEVEQVALLSEQQRLERAVENISLVRTAEATFPAMVKFILDAIEMCNKGSLKRMVTNPELVYDVNGAYEEVSIFSAAHESELLVEAGERPSPLAPSLILNSPPCIRGRQCRGYTSRIRGFPDTRSGAVLMQWMTPAELKDHYSTGRIPSERRLCILCHRVYVFMLWMHFSLRQTAPSNMLISHIGNIVDKVGEYKRCYCIVPDAQAFFLGLVRPVVRPNFLALHAVPYSPKPSLWRIDQSEMIVPPPSPPPPPPPSVQVSSRDRPTSVSLPPKSQYGLLEDLVDDDEPAHVYNHEDTKTPGTASILSANNNASRTGTKTRNNRGRKQFGYKLASDDDAIKRDASFFD